jgi:hypothetical protein
MDEHSNEWIPWHWHPWHCCSLLFILTPVSIHHLLLSIHHLLVLLDTYFHYSCLHITFSCYSCLLVAFLCYLMFVLWCLYRYLLKLLLHISHFLIVIIAYSLSPFVGYFPFPNYVGSRGKRWFIIDIVNILFSCLYVHLVV